MLALIPARSGSLRIPNKNIYNVNGHPLIAYTIVSAIESNIFDEIVVCTDSEEYAEIAEYYGAKAPGLRPASISRKDSPDCEWVKWILNLNEKDFFSYEIAFILRPTSPFRTSQTIKRAYYEFLNSDADTLRAVKPVSEHPGKMWVYQQDKIIPLIPLSISGVPFHSNQTNKLFDAFIQDASLEIFNIQNFQKTNSITGSSIMPFISSLNEGFDLNIPNDLIIMNELIKNNNVEMTKINKKSWFKK